MNRMILIFCTAIMIMVTVGCSITDPNVRADSSHMNHDKNDDPSATPTKIIPTDQQKLSVTVELKEINPIIEIKPTEQKIILDSQIEKKAQQSKKPLQGLFKTSLEAVQSKGKIDLNFTLLNISGNDLQISHSMGQRYDIWIYNEKNEEMYRWSYNKSFVQALIETSIKESSSMVFTEVWDQKDTLGHSIPVGPYTIVVQVMIALNSGNISQDELTAKATIDLK